MMLNEFVSHVTNGGLVEFTETMAVIAENYQYKPTEFCNGIQATLTNAAGQNEGSCKIFAFAKLHGFDQLQTLGLFGDYYRKDVLLNPEGNDHQNIRTFMRDGWAGIAFKGEALSAKHAD